MKDQVDRLRARPGRRSIRALAAAIDIAGQLRLRRREIPFTSRRNGWRPRRLPARRADERTTDRRGGPLHLAVGLRPRPAHRRAAKNSRSPPCWRSPPRPRKQWRRRHHAPPEIPRTAHSAQQFRAPQPLRTASAAPTTERTAAAGPTTSPARASSTSARGHRADRRPLRQGIPTAAQHGGQDTPERALRQEEGSRARRA